jgi:hypothetical protein
MPESPVARRLIEDDNGRAYSCLWDEPVETTDIYRVVDFLCPMEMKNPVHAGLFVENALKCILGVVMPP